MELNFPVAFKAVMQYASRTSPVKWNAMDMRRTMSSSNLPLELQLSPDADRTGYQQETDKILELLMDIKALFKRARGLLKRMGQEAGVGVEPDSQTLLVDATEEVEGVLCAGVPGAGGEDAVFALTVSAASRSKVEAMWSTWHVARGGGGQRDASASQVMVCPMLLHAETSKHSAGVRNESLSWV